MFTPFFNADERFLPLYQFAGEDNKKITRLDSFTEKLVILRDNIA